MDPITLTLAKRYTDEKTININTNHIFADEYELDDYFTANPSELEEGIYVQVGTAFFRYVDADWVDVTAIVTGPQGDTGAKGDTGEVSTVDMNTAIGSAITDHEALDADYDDVHGAGTAIGSAIGGHEALDAEYDDVHGAGTYADTKVSKSGDTIAGTIDFNGNILEKPLIKNYGETLVSLSNQTGTVNLNVASGNVFEVTQGADTVTYTFTNPGTNARSFTLFHTMNASAQSIVWPGSVDWGENGEPDAPAEEETAIYVFVTKDNGTTWYGLRSGTGFDA
jgi:hypothetical protein